MTPSRAKIHVPVVASALFLLALGGCGPTRPAADVLDVATARIAAARQADAATYAPLELRFAQERLDQAQAAVTAGDGGAAARLADESAANSDLAVVKARLGKVREAVDGLRQQNAALARDLPPETGSASGDRP